MPMKIALVGAGSRSFGAATVQDILLSQALCQEGIQLTLMDIQPEHLTGTYSRAQRLLEKYQRKATISATTDLEEALTGADFVVTAIEVERYLYWSQDFHVPRKYGFKQVYGENGGIGGIFHALRNMGPMMHIAQTMERVCPEALLLNYTNPEHKLVEAISRLTSINALGLCTGVFIGLAQLAFILDCSAEDLDFAACGINHFTWFQTLRDRKTGEDLYPRLRQVEAQGEWVNRWHDLALGRVLFRRFSLWPSPSTNHYGEYIRWAQEFMCSDMQFAYDPAEGHPWETGHIPEFVYTVDRVDTHRPWVRPDSQPEQDEESQDEAAEQTSQLLTVPIMEGVACGVSHQIAAVNTMNEGSIPNLPSDMVVEVPAIADANGVQPMQMQPLPEAIAAMLRLQGSIQKLTVEAYAEGSKDKLLQALLLEPTVDSYRQAVGLVDEMLKLQAGLLPKLS